MTDATQEPQAVTLYERVEVSAPDGGNGVGQVFIDYRPLDTAALQALADESLRGLLRRTRLLLGKFVDSYALSYKVPAEAAELLDELDAALKPPNDYDADDARHEALMSGDW